mmetsp:Transcript_11263/g.21164  ORF Transcript_11263/g.21164 Transcript_11263/m.21164 type:complete len:315 (+) Transcript_11263:158-1102(+)|eukprot:CAMPEP_0182611434 /NCGR_PEP_ID=MMETSP1330-20130603/13912_1 /TAXON_ID=464278 /ORGANISM="Picochlorum sp., Strain RCC944" /LENGTH=314 /DNA_ID=CAMNT_0024830829 /DNA_START=84 /DNA_END=1028 /DNA_ORIENTATION=-
MALCCSCSTEQPTTSGVQAEEEEERVREEEKQEGQEQSWPCPNCTYHNCLSKERCGLCGLLRKDINTDSASKLRDEGEDGKRVASGGAVQLETSTSQETVTLFAILPCRRILNGALRGVFALVGSVAGAVAGAVAAHSSRSGLVRGVGLGALAGAIVSMEALETSQILFDGSSATIAGRYNAAISSQSAASGPRALSFQILFSNSSRYTYPTRDVEDGSGTSNSIGNGSGSQASGSCQRVGGLSPEQLRNVPYKLAGGGSCAICFEAFKEGEHVRVLPTCKHDFHARCLDPWLRNKASCPMCRREVIPELKKPI